MRQGTLALSIPAMHPAYAGHFPERPILPGVVLLDEVLHALAQHEGLSLVACSIKSAKFPSPVRPGEALALNYAGAPTGEFRFEIVAGGRVVAAGVLALPPPEPTGAAA